ncbi:MAG: hypothetical protein IKC07_03375 [Clostridia bacterium]|nr:hypothetical protein [Clostridia bacterium]
MADTDRGYLIIQVSTAGRGLPIEGAHITISRTEENERDVTEMVLLTDRNGQTEKVSLPAPNRENSLTPSGTDNYSTYKIQTEKEGYYPVENLEVPIFGGKSTIQPVALIPLPFGYTANPIIIDDKEPEDL